MKDLRDLNDLTIHDVKTICKTAEIAARRRQEAWNREEKWTDRARLKPSSSSSSLLLSSLELSDTKVYEP